MIKKHVLHKRSAKLDAKPLPIDIEHGEIAINYHKGEETLFIKNDGNEVVPMPFKGGGGGDMDALAIGFMTTLNDKYTGLADYYGLKAIGWTYEDIFHYQKHGVNWNREDNDKHKVPQNNIDLYGVIDASNIQDYIDILVYLPKIDTSNGTSFSEMFVNCPYLTSIPLIDTSRGTNFRNIFNGCTSLTSIPLLNTRLGIDFSGMFNDCPSLTTIPLLNTSKGTIFNHMFSGCPSLTSIPLLDTSKGRNFSSMFYGCTSLTLIPLLNTSNGTDFRYMFQGCTSLTSIPLLDVSQGTMFNSMFYGCASLTSIPLLDVSNATKWNNFGSMFYNCSILSELNLKGLPLSINLSYINKVTINKESLLYIINNSTATSAITIKLDANNYGIYSVDADVIAALTKKPFVTLIQG